MVCPSCRSVGSRYSDECSHYGALLRRAGLDAGGQLLLPFVPPPPTPPAPATSSFSRSPVVVGPAPRLASKSHFRAIRWNFAAIAVLLMGSAFFGYGIRRLVEAGQSALTPPPLPVVIAASPRFDPMPFSPPVPQSVPRLVQPAPAQPLPALGSLHPATENDVIPRFFTANGAPLRLQNKFPVSRRTRLQITKLYNQWEQSHSEGADQVGHFMGFYAPDAQIFQVPGHEISCDALRALAIEVRNMGTFFSVRDQKPLLWARNARGDRIEPIAFHCYGHDSGDHIWGQRRLVWQKRASRWLIVRDDFPPRYSVSS